MTQTASAQSARVTGHVSIFKGVGITLRVRTPVPRCPIPGLDPTHGVRNLEVMKELIRYRPKQAYPGQPPESAVTPGFATYAEVVEPGTVRVGDQVELVS